MLNKQHKVKIMIKKSFWNIMCPYSHFSVMGVAVYN